MTRCFSFWCLLVGLSVVTACYPLRRTGNLENFPDITEETTAIVEKSEMSQEDLENRQKELERIRDQPPPVYHINAGDSVQIVVYNHEDLNLSTVVTPDGYIGIVFAGQIQVAGLTLAEAAKKIENELAKYVKKPSVGISPTTISSETATITGAVAGGGMYGISNGMRLSDLYAKAGGSSVRAFDGQWLDAADLVNSMFVRDGKIVPIDFRLAIEKGDPLHNLTLRKRDYIYIAVRSESMVCLVGAVSKPHKRIWDNNLGLLEVLTTGGWLDEHYWPYIIIIRGSVANPTMYKIDVDAIVTGRAPNVMLKAGDVIFVPHDNISEYNVFVRKLLPTGQLLNIIASPIMWWSRFN